MAAREQGDAVADVRRDQMLSAASTLIAERGFSDTRLADVAERVGASPALVIYYFGPKDSQLTHRQAPRTARDPGRVDLGRRHPDRPDR